MRAMVLGLVAVAALANGEAVAGGAPSGWRQATKADADAVASRLGAKAQDRPPGQVFEVSGDFDGDGRRDQARVMIDTRRGRLAVFIQRGAGGRPQMVQSDKLDALIGVGLSVQPAGSYPTACGRGAGDDRAPCRPVVTSRHPLLMMSYFEASDIVFRWRGKRFVGDALTD